MDQLLLPSRPEPGLSQMGSHLEPNRPRRTLNPGHILSKRSLQVAHTPEAAARPRAAAGAADSAAVGLERRPDASGQRVRSGARSRAAHRQALRGQGAGGGGADGCKLNLMNVVTR